MKTKQEKTNYFLDLYDIMKEKSFRKYFKCENDKRKFIKKLRYSTKLMIIGLTDLSYYYN